MDKFRGLVSAGLLLIMGFSLGCAAIPVLGKRSTANDQQFQKGLKYSEWLFKQPVDFLEGEPFRRDLKQLSAAEKRVPPPPKEEALPPQDTIRTYAVQVGSFRYEQNARNFLQQVREGHPQWKFSLHFSDGLWRVVVGFYGTHADAEVIRDLLREEGFPDAWIYRFSEWPLKE
jgi:hypothetical protein